MNHLETALALIDVATEGKPQLRAQIREHLSAYLESLPVEEYELVFSLDDSDSN
jgi:hypothetical protein